MIVFCDVAEMHRRRGWGCGSLVEFMLRIRDAQGSIPSMKK
jgi:hypothetical protein